MYVRRRGTPNETKRSVRVSPAVHCRKYSGETSFSPTKKIILGVLSVLLVAATVWIRQGGNTTSTSVDSSITPSLDGTMSKGIVYSPLKENGKVLRYAAYEDADKMKPVSIQQWAERMKESSLVRKDFTKKLQDCPHKAFFFETKGVSKSSASEKQFEFVLVDTPSLYSFAEGNPDPHTFAEHLRCLPESQPGCSFTSLGGDATLIAPRPLKGEKRDNVVYSHLGAFVRGAPSNQVDKFLKLVATEYLAKIQERKVWLSTDGTGVAWLHMRLDSRPKYYSYKEFANDSS